MSWVAIHVTISADNAEHLSEVLFDLGALSVSVEDALAGTDREEPIFGEPGVPGDALWKENILSALFDADTDGNRIIEAVASRLDIPTPPYRLETIADTDWVRATQAQFDPIAISDRLWITPTWHTPPEDSTAVNLILDPGLAFGTGSHPTTRLCLQWLDSHDLMHKTLLDYGCGSGILAIAAMKLGAKQADGVDIDPQAMIASKQNAEQNQVNVNFYLPDALPAGQYDLVVANILTNPLKALATILAYRCAPGGQIILSGILSEQANDILTIYQEWFDIALAKEEEGWVLLHGIRRSA